MAEKDQGNEDDLKLELPSLSFGRRRKRKAEQAAADGPAGQADTDAPAEAGTPVAAEEPAAETAAVATPTEPVPQTPDRFAPPPADPQAVHEAAPAPYVAPETDGAADLAARPGPPAPQPFEDTTEGEPTAVLPEASAAGSPEPEPAKAPRPARAPRQVPRLSGPVAATLVGAFVGIFACGATYVGLLGCQEIRGTSSCGGPGFFLLIAILVALIWLGSRLLGLLGIGDAGSTSFLGVGLLAVVALAFLIDVIFEWWMILVIPGVGALTFLGAHWLTARFAEPTTD